MGMREPILEVPAHIAALPEEEQGPALVKAIHDRKQLGHWEEMRGVIPPFLLETAQLIADAYGSVRVVRNLEGITIDCPKNPGIKPIVYRYEDLLVHRKYVRNEEHGGVVCEECGWEVASKLPDGLTARRMREHEAHQGAKYAADKGKPFEPEGNPTVPSPELLRAMQEKVREAARESAEGDA